MCYLVALVPDHCFSFLLFKKNVFITNSACPDQTTRSAASVLDLHRWGRPLLRDDRQ